MANNPNDTTKFDGPNWRDNPLENTPIVRVAGNIRDHQTIDPSHTLPGLPRGWFLASIIVRRDEAWCYSGRGPLTYDALLEGGDSAEAVGSGSTPAAAVRAALKNINDAL